MIRLTLINYFEGKIVPSNLKSLTIQEYKSKQNKIRLNAHAKTMTKFK